MYGAPIDLVPRWPPAGVATRRNPSPAPSTPPVPGLVTLEPPPQPWVDMPVQVSRNPAVGSADAVRSDAPHEARTTAIAREFRKGAPMEFPRAASCGTGIP